MSGFQCGGRLVTRQCSRSVDESVALLRKELEARKLTVFAEFNHGENAAKAGVELAPTRVVVFGNPAVGTLLMQRNPLAAIELPLRMLVWEQKDGTVWLAYPDLQKVGSAYNIGGMLPLTKMAAMLEALADAIA